MFFWWFLFANTHFLRVLGRKSNLTINTCPQWDFSWSGWALRSLLKCVILYLSINQFSRLNSYARPNELRRAFLPWSISKNIILRLFLCYNVGWINAMNEFCHTQCVGINVVPCSDHSPFEHHGSEKLERRYGERIQFYFDIPKCRYLFSRKLKKL